MRALPLVSDPTYQKKDPFTGINEYFVSLIKDERDLPFDQAQSEFVGRRVGDEGKTAA